MSWTKNTYTASVGDREFLIESEGRMVPGVCWTPVGPTVDRLVLLGHGGTADKRVEYITLIAHALCARGIAAMAIDGPGHGERAGADQFEGNPDDFKDRWESDGGTAGMLADWKAAFDFLEQEDGERTTGYLGLSMGTMMGLPLCVAEDRIKVAVLGLMGTWGPNKSDLVQAAPKLDIPVRFLVQSDDEVVPRDRCFDLFDALGTAKKTMHVNPGAHAAVPVFEMEAGVDYLDTQLAKLGSI